MSARVMIDTIERPLRWHTRTGNRILNTRAQRRITITGEICFLRYNIRHRCTYVTRIERLKVLLK